MSRKLFFILFVFILLSSLLYVGLNPLVESTNGSAVWNKNTDLFYATIQEAINANETLDGHSLYLDVEVFYEHVIVNKSVGLYGSFWIEHPEVITTIDGKGTGIVVTVEADNVTIHSIKIINGVNGIVLEEADNSLLWGLSVVDNAETGIYLRSSRNCMLKYSNIASNRYNFGVEGSSVEHFFHKVVSSTVNGKSIHYLTNDQDKNITEDAGYIATVNCTNITIENQNLTNNWQGLLFAYTNNSIIRNTNISNNLYGIFIKSSNNNLITSCICHNNSLYGIMLNESSNNQIANCKLYNNFWHGAYIYKSKNNTFIDNLVYWNRYQGIRLSYSSNNTVAGNHIYQNNAHGLGLGFSSGIIIRSNSIYSNNYNGIEFDSSSNNVICDNNISLNDDYGIELEGSSNNLITNNEISNNRYGIYSFYSSNNNLIHHNNFINNTYQVHVGAIDGYPPNTWDDGVEGNYWSDYEEKYPEAQEIDGSGIWDTPYVINENNQDNYPIVPEFPSFLILPLFMIATLLAVIVYRTKHTM